MRKTQINDILELFKSIYSAHSLVANFVQKCEFSKAEMILEECQKCAIDVGMLIDESEGEGTIPVKLLEDYCENIYQIAIALREYENCAGKIERKLTKKLVSIENSIKRDIKIKYEIVFFPYKASMWDSFESIWRVAAADEKCEVYVVPIPYYERKPDGTFGKMLYEGGEYPEDVKILDWKMYDVQSRRPDVIYIHNPYDDMNYVTSVHPDYYSSNLKQYTDCIVYVPYFVGMGDWIERKLCMAPAILYADKVIVQSETVKKTYIEEYHKMEIENKCKNFFGVAEEKFLGLGSPKHDAIFKMERKSIPQEWLNKVYKPNEKKKKVILYNTTVGALLIYRHKYLAKVKEVISVFNKYTDQIILLWRPHPLLRNTISSMAPELLEEYDEIIREYKEENIGILDETSDLDRAISFSDAYYGDKSSVVGIYRKTNKPIMIQKLK